MLVEDHELSRKGIHYGLKAFEHFDIVAEAENGKEAIKLFQETKPDVVLMDIGLPFTDGISATQTIKTENPDVRIIMLTSYNEKDKIFNSFKSGADAYCMKNIQVDKLAQIIDLIFDGGIWIDPNIAKLVIEAISLLDQNKESNQQSSASDYEFMLTAREKEILKLIAKGMNNKEISENLVISIHTVKNHVKSVIHKLAVTDRTQAAILAIQKGLI